MGVDVGIFEGGVAGFKEGPLEGVVGVREGAFEEVEVGFREGRFEGVVVGFREGLLEGGESMTIEATAVSLAAVGGRVFP